MKYFIIVCLFLNFTVWSQTVYKKIKITKDLELVQLTPTVYVHTSYSEDPVYGRFASNGLLVLDKKKAILFDTPVSEDVTKDLVSWVHYSMKNRIVSFVPNHWHSDCMGGLSYLHQIGVVSYSNQKTIDIARQKQLPFPMHGFTDSLDVTISSHKVQCYYFGAAHSLDNIVVWLPQERILFAGCMVKSLDSKNLGNTIDGDLAQWPTTIKTLMTRFSSAQIVIPGHGDFGTTDLLQHTLDLLSK